MTDFYKLSGQAQCKKLALLAEAAVDQWNLSVESLELIKHRENAVYKLTTKEGIRYAIRVHRANYHSDVALNSEIQWMEALRCEANVITPEFVKAPKGEYFLVVSHEEVPEPRQVDILEWVDGEAMGSIENGITNHALSLTDSFSLIGEIAAKCHNHSSSWQLPKGFSRQAWDLDGLVGENPVWGRFWELEVLSAAEVKTMIQVHGKLREILTEFGQSSDRYSLIHCDLLPENLLHCGNHYKLIDFDDSGFGWHLFDLATSLFFHLGEDYFDDIVAAWVEGYRKHRELSDEHLAMLPVFLMARGTTYLGWAHTRKETDDAKELTPMVKEGVLALAEHFLAEE